MCREFVVRVRGEHERKIDISSQQFLRLGGAGEVEWCAYVSISSNGEGLKIVLDEREEDGQDRLFIYHIATLFQFSS